MELHSDSKETIKINQPNFFEYEKSKTEYVDQTNKIISNFAKYFNLNVINRSKIKKFAEKSVEFNFALRRVSVNFDGLNTNEISLTFSYNQIRIFPSTNLVDEKSIR